METRDWSLVVFTVLTQGAVGAFLVLQVLEYLAMRRGRGDGRQATDTAEDNNPVSAGARGNEPEAGSVRKGGFAETFTAHAGDPPPAMLPIVLAVLSAGLFAALFHLSDPLQAARAVVNFSSSWLSREIVFGGLFAALLGVLVWCETGAGAAHPASRALATWLPRLTAMAGLAFVGCQTAIYLLPAQPAWNSFATPAGFGGTALRLGFLGVASGLAVQRLTMTGDALPVSDHASSGRTQATLRGLALAGIAALALEFVVVPLHLASLAANPLPAAAASVQRLTGDYGGILLLRLGLLGAAAAALVGVLVTIRRAGGKSGPSPHPLAPVLACGAFGLTAVSEVCGRFLFYAMQVRVGI
jgi:anaerobic dimethyl sulfoxide reductase subunit C (anchor subunit)